MPKRVNYPTKKLIVIHDRSHAGVERIAGIELFGYHHRLIRAVGCKEICTHSRREAQPAPARGVVHLFERRDIFSPAEDLSAGKLIRKSANLESSTVAQSAAFEALTKSAALTFYFRNGECRQRSFSVRRSYRRRTPRSRSCFRAKIIRLFRTRCRRKQGRHKVPALSLFRRALKWHLFSRPSRQIRSLRGLQ